MDHQLEMVSQDWGIIGSMLHCQDLHFHLMLIYQIRKGLFFCRRSDLYLNRLDIFTSFEKLKEDCSVIYYVEDDHSRASNCTIEEHREKMLVLSAESLLKIKTILLHNIVFFLVFSKYKISQVKVFFPKVSDLSCRR